MVVYSFEYIDIFSLDRVNQFLYSRKWKWMLWIIGEKIKADCRQTKTISWYENVRKPWKLLFRLTHPQNILPLVLVSASVLCSALRYLADVVRSGHSRMVMRWWPRNGEGNCSLRFLTPFRLWVLYCIHLIILLYDCILFLFPFFETESYYV